MTLRTTYFILIDYKIRFIESWNANNFSKKNLQSHDKKEFKLIIMKII